MDPNLHAVPGTAHLVDINQSLHVKHGEGELANIVLIPRPTNDPDDPLNWKPWRKALSTASMCMFTMMTGLAAASIYSIIVPISQDTGLSINDLNAGTGYQYLAFGWGCLIWQPAALQFGKRPIYLISLLASLGVTVSVPYVRTPGAWLALKVLQGLVGAPIESLGEISIADIYFSHERGTYMALYAFTLYTSGFLTPVLAGFINDGMGWQWVQYWCAIWLGIGFLFCFFFMEETNYDRPSILNEEERIVHETGARHASDTEHVIAEPKQADLQAEHAEDLARTPSQNYTPKTYIQKLKLWDKPRPLSHLFHGIIRPLRLLSFPVIAFSGFSYGCSLIWYNVLNATASLILSGPPYNFRPSMVGLTYVSPIIGVILGSIVSGKLGDWFVLRLARRRNGIWESEYRLWINVVLAIFLPASLILWGVGAAQGVHWFGLVFAMGMIGICVSIGAQLSLSYCIDTYKDFGADAVVSVMIIRNTMSFAMGYGVTPWVVNMGYQNAFITGAFAGLAQVLTFLIFVKWGPRIRQASADRYRKELKRAKLLGIGH